MCGLVSWAVCGTGQSREHRANHELLLTENSRYFLLHAFIKILISYFILDTRKSDLKEKKKKKSERNAKIF